MNKFSLHYSYYVLMVLLLLPTQSWTQPLVISVDSNMSANADKSLAGALAASLVLPGSGEYYLDHGSRSKYFWGADLMGWAAVFVAWHSAERELSAAQNYAGRYASASDAPRDPEFLALLASWASRGGSDLHSGSPDNGEDYNQDLLRQGLSVNEEYPNTEKYSWDWGLSDNPENTMHQKEFAEIMSRYRTGKIVFQASVGLLVLNRLLSLVDVLQIYRSTAVKKASSERENRPIHFVILPNLDGHGAALGLQVNL
jgi:hypothetical protein